MSYKKTDKMKLLELQLEEPIHKFLRREYKESGVTITSLSTMLYKKTGMKIGRATIWKWLKLFNIRSKEWT